VNNVFKISGLNAWTEAHKAASGFYLASRMGENAKVAFADLNPHYAATLRRAGLEERWGLMQKLAGQEADGNIYVLPENARNLTDADLEPHLPERLREDKRPADAERAENFDAARAAALDRLRRNLELDLLGYIHDEVGYAVIEPDAKTTAVQTQGLAPGTLLQASERSDIRMKTALGNSEFDAKKSLSQSVTPQDGVTASAKGEVARSVMQFKSFPVAYFQRILMEQRWLRAADTGVFNHVGGMAFAVAACATMGYVSITSRDLSRGKEPRDPRKLETVFASLVQGGGLSIVGDFFLGKLNRWGGGMAETAMGPTLGAALLQASERSDIRMKTAPGNAELDAKKSLSQSVTPQDGVTASASLATAGNTALHGEGVQARDNLIRLGQSRMPYANLWWAKAALDYGVNFHIREWLSPGSLGRSEAALKRDFNQKYLRIGGLDLSPAKHIQRGGGFR
jgi:hypothetical protein